MPPPWLARVALIKEAAQFNADTERKVVHLSEELKDMLREVRLRVRVLNGAIGTLLKSARIKACRKPASRSRHWSDGSRRRASKPISS
jgi:dynactin 1